MRAVIALFGSLVILLLPAAASAQLPVRSPTAMGRIVEARAEPTSPPFGQVFDLHVTVRAARDRPLIVVDTLGPTYALRSAGRAEWELAEAPGDSVDLVAVFPVISFRSGFEPLPGLLLVDGRDYPAVTQGAGVDEEGSGEEGRAAAGDPPTIRVIGGPTELPGLDETGIVQATGGPSVVARAYLGDTEIGALDGLPTQNDAPPRPPADVLGGNWSPWAVLALLAMLAAAAGLARMAVPVLRARWPVRERLSLGGGPLSRDEALRRLDEIRAAGWHDNGRIDDFYRASTDTLRRYMEGRDPRWSEALTSHELLLEARQRWGATRLRSVEPAVGVAERVKFGGLRPEASQADRDWDAIRSWIADEPGETGGTP